MTLDDFICEFNSNVCSSNHISLRINFEFKKRLSSRLYSVTLDGPIYHKIFNKPPSAHIYYMSNAAFSLHKAIKGLISKINNCNSNDEIVVQDRILENSHNFIVGEKPIPCCFGFFTDPEDSDQLVPCRTIKFNFDVDAAYFQLQENEVKFALIDDKIERLYE